MKTHLSFNLRFVTRHWLLNWDENSPAAAVLSRSPLFPSWTDGWHSKIPLHILTCLQMSWLQGTGGGCGGFRVLHSHFDRYSLISSAHFSISISLSLLSSHFASCAGSTPSHVFPPWRPALVDPRVSSRYPDWQLYEPRRAVRPHCGGVKVCKTANMWNYTPPPRQRGCVTRKETAATETQIFSPHLSYIYWFEIINIFAVRQKCVLW